MYYAFITDNRINGCGQCICLNDEVENVEISEEVYNEIEKYIYSEGEIIPDSEYQEKQTRKEKERINGLSMTRSDFFDGTIKAFGADSDELLTAIENILDELEIDSTEKKIALNNYQNALNFYRRHSLFTLLSNIPIRISNELTVTVSEEQWDNFFDQTDKKNPDAYKELLPPSESSETEIE